MSNNKSRERPYKKITNEGSNLKIVFLAKSIRNKEQE